MVVSSLPDMMAAAYRFFFCGLFDKKEKNLFIFKAKTVKEAEDKLIEMLPNLPDMVLVDYELAGLGPNGLELAE